MSFQALARTWRPRRFDELVGQNHVVRALTHALDHDKLHHALLFSGTRGVGKTTLARIIAKCLNCERGVSAQPCRGDDICATCREIDEGRYVDLIEVDAASRTGVDDTRDLMDNVQYAPTRGRTKVYLIDEVHMLTKHSFNALLKTLEEPPPRVQFLLATTEPEKIPVTILSRCLQFPLKRLPATQIAERLAVVTATESLSAEDDALTEIARAADGSMRDGLSLLDQAIAFGDGALEAAAVRDMLGTIGDSRVGELVEAVVAGRAGEAMNALEALYSQGIDMRYLLDALATAWQHIAVLQILGEAPDEASLVWEDTARTADPAAIQLFYDITLGGVRDFVYAPDPLVGVKMTVLRMLAFDPHAGANDGAPPSAAQSAPSEPPVAAAEHSDGLARLRERLHTPSSNTRSGNASSGASEIVARRSDGAATEQPRPAQPSISEETSARRAPEPMRPSREPDPADRRMSDAPAGLADDADAACQNHDDGHIEGDHPEDWHRLIKRMPLAGFGAQLAHNGVCRRLDSEVIELQVARANALLVTPGARGALENALAELWAPRAAPRLRVKVVDEVADTPAIRVEQDTERRQREAVASIENDPIVKQLRDRLGARLRPETIKPIRSDKAVQQRDDP